MSNYEYERITEKIIASLEQGRIPWQATWNNQPRNAISKRKYSGINMLLLGMSDHVSPYWLTYAQARGNNGNVRRGEEGQTVVFWKLLKTEVEGDNGKKSLKTIPLLKTYTVFNIDQCDGLDKLRGTLELKDNEMLDDPQQIVDGYVSGPAIEFKGCQPCYKPTKDVVEIPDKSNFTSSESYYSVLFHELVHSTGHESRLNRLSKTAHFGNESYSKEELVAELGSCFLCANSKLEPITNNNVAYIQSWISALRNDVKMVVYAASQAQKAVDLILGCEA
jgi:antirestriction protein ArdC